MEWCPPFKKRLQTQQASTFSSLLCWEIRTARAGTKSASNHHYKIEAFYHAHSANVFTAAHPLLLLPERPESAAQLFRDVVRSVGV